MGFELAKQAVLMRAAMQQFAGPMLQDAQQQLDELDRAAHDSQRLIERAQEASAAKRFLDALR